MKPPILGAIALIVGLGAGTGAKVMTTHPAPVVADSTHADSTKADSLKGEGAEGEHVQQAGEARTVTDTAVVASGAGEHAPIQVGPAPEVPTQHGPARPTAATPANAAVFAAALEARVESAKTAAAKAAEKAAAPQVDTAVVASQKRVAKIFTSMDAKAAAKVLVQMNDNDIHIILGYVGPKQAAQIMTELPPERVAKLSKLEMGTK
jgi:hypothetical protein